MILIDKIEIIITCLNMTWFEAVIYAHNRSMYLPSIEMSKEWELPPGFWTCNTDVGNIMMAHTTTMKQGYNFSMYKGIEKSVIICSDQWTDQIESLTQNDIKSYDEIH